MPGLSSEYLAQQIQQTNRRLAEAIDAFRHETIAPRGAIADLDAEIGKINTSLCWISLRGGQGEHQGPGRRHRQDSGYLGSARQQAGRDDEVVHPAALIRTS
jgi:hypothetical protein